MTAIQTKDHDLLAGLEDAAPIESTQRPTLATGNAPLLPQAGPALAEQLAKPSQAKVLMGPEGMVPADMEGLQRVAAMYATSGLVPDSISKGANDRQTLIARVCVILEAGYARGLTASQSMAGIMIVRNIPAVWGDLMVALMQRHKAYRGHKTVVSGEGETLAATTTVRRMIGDEVVEFVGKFSWKDAARAGLTGKDTYKGYPADLLSRRSGSRAIRAGFADALGGLASADETQDGIDTEAAFALDKARALEKEINNAAK